VTIDNRNLTRGTKLVARYKGQEYACTVVQREEGIRYHVPAHGGFHKSLSAAGSAVTGAACNGWRFWSVKGSKAAEPAPAKAEAEPEGFRRIPGGRAWCNGCAAAFKVKAGSLPATCPQGHTPGAEEIEREAVTA
jgi:hypothetical protein